MQNLGTKIRMSFYEGSDGPRIMLFGPPDVNLKSLQELFHKLSEGNLESRIENCEFVAAFGDVQILAKCSGPMFENGHDKRLAQGLTRKSKKLPQFIWSRTAEGWDYLANLIDGLIDHNGPGHQYLTRYPGEDAIVVVSKGEYSDDVLLR